VEIAPGFDVGAAVSLRSAVDMAEWRSPEHLGRKEFKAGSVGIVDVRHDPYESCGLIRFTWPPSHQRRRYRAASGRARAVAIGGWDQPVGDLGMVPPQWAVA
jgi:hypothetical protein